MADKPNDNTSKQNQCDDIAQRVRAQIIQGDVGYGRPPKEHQFKKGQSGNSRGRSRGSPKDLSFSDQPTLNVARQVATKRIKIREGDKIREVVRSEALVESIFVYAMKGNARFAGYALDLTRIAEQEHVREVRESNEFWSSYRCAARNLIAEAKARGEPEPELPRHPDDIITDRDGRLRHIGPFDEISKAAIEKNIVLRQAYLLQGGLDERLTPKPADGDPLKGPGTALQFAKLINRSLPPRLRMDEFRMFYRVDYYSRHSLRWLLKTVFDTWRKAGMNRKRGELSPPLGEGLAAVDIIYRFGEAILAGSFDENSGAGQFMELILENREFAEQQGWI